MKSLLFWTPRILCLLFAAFVSIFAADVFSEGQGFWDTTLRLLIHLIPTGIVLVALAISWRQEWVGAILFTALGVLFGWRFSSHVMIYGPLFIVSSLFLVNWLYRSQTRHA